MAYFFSPIGNTQIIDANGDPLVGGTISTFLAGTSTAETTYTDDTGGTPQGVVMTLNSLGLPENGPVWLLGGVPLKFIIKDADGVTQSTFDDVSGIGDTASAVEQWTLYGAAPTYISATSFSVAGDQTNIFQSKRKLESINSGGTTYSTISTSSFGSGITTVVVVNTSGVLDAGMSSVSYGILSAVNDSIPTTIARVADIQSQAYTAFTTTGTSTALVLTPSPAITANTAKTKFDVEFHVAPTGTPTLAVSGLAALPLKFRDPTGSLQTVTATQCPINWHSPVYTDGTNWILLNVASFKFLGAYTTLSGLSNWDSEAIPAYATEIKVHLVNVSTSGTNAIIAQLSDSGGRKTSGYISTGGTVSTTGYGESQYTAGFGVRANLAADVYSGTLIFNLVDAANFVYVATGTLVKTDSTGDTLSFGGTVTMTGLVTAVRVTTNSGDTFDTTGGTPKAVLSYT